MVNTMQKQGGIQERIEETNPFGPRCTPLFYTALLTVPQRLNWSEMPDAAMYRITLRLSDPGGNNTPLWSAFTAPDAKPASELPKLDLQPGTLYTWQVEPCIDSDIAQNPQKTWDARRQPTSSGMQAYFWLLDPDTLAHVRYGLGLLERSPDPEYTLLARAILLSEVGLFQDAIRLVKQGTQHEQRPARPLLTDTALSVIYRQMEKHLGAQAGLPSCFTTWVHNREQYHRSRVRSQQEKFLNFAVASLKSKSRA